MDARQVALVIELQRTGLDLDFQIVAVAGFFQVGDRAFDFGHVQCVVDPNDAGVWRIDQADARKYVVQQFGVVGIVERDHRGGRVAASQTVDSRDVDVDLFENARVAKLGHADASGVAVGVFGQTADDDLFDFRIFVGGGFVVVVLAADNVGVHAGAADVLADLVDDQDVDFLEGQLRHPLTGLDEQFFFAVFEFVGRDGGDLGGLVVAVFNDRHAGDNAAPRQNFARDAANDLAKAVVHDRAVIDFCTFVFAQADQHHLHQAAFDVADETRVWFDSPTNDDMVGFRGVLVEVNRKSFLGIADDDRFHAGANFAAAEFFRHAIRFNHFALTFRGSAAVAAHRWDEEWNATALFDVVGDAFDDDVDVGNAAAAGRDGDGFAGFDLVAQREAGELRFDLGWDVIDARAFERLANAEHEGIVGHGWDFGGMDVLERGLPLNDDAIHIVTAITRAKYQNAGPSTFPFVAGLVHWKNRG